VFELDAASNNSVDDIRNLIDQVRIPPQTGQYKVYIIDEVHMLSTAAFNAFLKTLEEPPPYAIFILATTEKHKILPTILSRCQIYDFKRISVNDIAAHLRNIANQENIKAEDDALHIIAEKADGALRDALSIFDRLVSFAGDNLTYEAVVKNLNVLDYDYFFKLTETLLAEDTAAAFLIFDEILTNGFEGDHFIHGLAAHFRNLMVCKDQRTISLLELSDSLKERYLTQARIAPIEFLVNGLNLASDCDVHYAQSQNKRLLVELTLMKIAFLSKAIEGNSLAEKKNGSSEVVAYSAEKKTTETSSTSNIASSLEVTQNVSNVVEANKTPEPAKPKIITSLEELEKQVLLDEQKKKNPTVNSEVEEVTGQKVVFNQENVSKVWDELAENFREKERLSLYETISDLKASITDNGISIMANSEVEKEYIEKDMPEILSFFRNRIDKANFEIEILVDARPENRKIIINTKDKYDMMATKNPLLINLKDSLGLEIEH
jgi:DNA polymerase-3 subunit gamma/tau